MTDIYEISNSSDYQDYEHVEFETSGSALGMVSTKRGGDISPRVLETLITNCSEQNDRMPINEIGRMSGRASSSS